MAKYTIKDLTTDRTLGWGNNLYQSKHTCTKFTELERVGILNSVGSVVAEYNRGKYKFATPPVTADTSNTSVNANVVVTYDVDDDGGTATPPQPKVSLIIRRANRHAEKHDLT
jgi:hypothetical protein